MKQITGLLEWLTEAARRHAEIERIFLFGSFARGDASDVSDVDVAISLSDIGQWSALAQSMRETAPVLRKLDLVCFEKISERFRKKILEEGVVIYDRSQK